MKVALAPSDPIGNVEEPLMVSEALGRTVTALPVESIFLTMTRAPLAGTGSVILNAALVASAG